MNTGCSLSRDYCFVDFFETHPHRTVHADGSDGFDRRQSSATVISAGTRKFVVNRTNINRFGLVYCACSSLVLSPASHHEGGGNP